MNFGEKIKFLRKEKGLTQAELAKSVGLSTRAIQNYEIAGSYPKKRIIYNKLAEALDVEINYLLTENEEFVIEAENNYPGKGAKDAEDLINNARALFAGGEITDEMKDEVMQALQKAYWVAKKDAQKYTPKSHIKEDK